MISSESEMTTDSARFSLMTPSDADDSLSATGLVSPDYAGAPPPPPGMLTFAVGGRPEEDSAAVTTPLAAGNTMPREQKMEMILEHAGNSATEPQESEIALSRIPTYDEGIADLAADVVSKDSSAGDSTGERKKEEAAEIRKKLELLKLEKEK